jgi:hypothetical protein
LTWKTQSRPGAGTFGTVHTKLKFADALFPVADFSATEDTEVQHEQASNSTQTEEEARARH